MVSTNVFFYGGFLFDMFGVAALSGDTFAVFVGQFSFLGEMVVFYCAVFAVLVAHVAGNFVEVGFFDVHVFVFIL